MHIWTHLKGESEGVTGHRIFAGGMVEHDRHVGRLLDKLDELGITENTIVIYSTDNGVEVMSWPDGGATIFKGEVHEGPRKEMFYFTNGGSISAQRYSDWKINFGVQNAHGFDV